MELPALERRIGAIGAIAQVAPLVGLLGTVLGFISTFAAFQRDYATASVLARGMWEALLCTAGGIMLAIPAHLALHFLNGRVRAIVRDMEWSGNEIMKVTSNTGMLATGPPPPPRSRGPSTSPAG